MLIEIVAISSLATVSLWELLHLLEPCDYWTLCLRLALVHDFLVIPRCMGWLALRVECILSAHNFFFLGHGNPSRFTYRNRYYCGLHVSATACRKPQVSAEMEGLDWS